MSLLALLAFLAASGLVVAAAEPVGKTRQRRADDRSRREQEQENERKSAAKKAEADEKQRQQRLQRIRERLRTPEGFRARMETIRRRDLVPLAALEAARDSANDLAQRLTRLATRIRSALPAGSGQVWPVVAAVLVGVIWATGFTVEVLIDQRSLVGLDYTPAMALLLAMIASLIFSLIGLALSDMVGLTRLLPLPEMRKLTRAVVIVDLIAILVWGLSLLPPVMQYRSAPLSAQVATLEQNQRVLEETPGVAAGVKANVAHKLAAAEEKLDTAHYTDQRLGIGAATLEALTSWGAVWLAMLAANAGLLARAGRTRRRARAIDVEITKRDRQFQAKLAELAEENQITPEQLRGMLMDQDGESPQPPGQDAEPDQPDPEPPPQPADPPPQRSNPPPQSSDPPQQPPPGAWPAF